ncbi:MAG: flagellar protein FliO/FliZ [Halieaceae bacterium]
MSSAYLTARNRWLLALLPLFIFPLDVLAETTEIVPRDMLSAGYMFQVFGSLVLVFACIFLLMFVAKKFQGIPVTDKRVIRTLAAAKMGPREKVVLLDVDGRQLLVGVTSNNISTLLVLDSPIENLDTVAENGMDFTSLLSSMRGQGGA